MNHRSSTRTGATRRTAALALAAAASALLVFSASAGATIFTPADSDTFVADLATANTNGTTDTIILSPGVTYAPTTPQTISEDITITADHSYQNFDALGPSIEGGGMDPLAAHSITVNTGVTADFHGIQIQGASQQPFAALRVLGTARLNGVTVVNSGGYGIQGGPASTMTLTNTLVNSGAALGINLAGGTSSTNLINSLVSNNTGGGISGAGILNLRNTAVVLNGTTQCFRKATAATASFDSGTAAADQCGVGTGAAQHGAAQLGLFNGNGGPMFSRSIPTTSPLYNTGSATYCPTTDQRFFVRTGPCDIGPFENGATQDTTDATCIVTGGTPGVSQDVTLADSESGVGPGAVYSEPPAVEPTPPSYPDPVTDPVWVFDPDNAVWVATNIPYMFISNGTVGYTPLTSPVKSAAPNIPGLVLTATKAAPGKTRWSFTAQDWAGNVRDCR